LDCVLDNGGIVAANSTKSYYPSEAKNYFYIWPRDAIFTAVAAEKLGINLFDGLNDWLINRAEGWKEKGLFYEKYFPNGLKARKRFQPDQGGTVIYFFSQFSRKNKIDKYKKLITKTADGLCAVWNKDKFIIDTNDVWEERYGFSDLKSSFSYSLSACVAGLEEANKIYPKSLYRKTAKEMKKLLLDNLKKTKYIPRLVGSFVDNDIDASSLGLIWPFASVGVKTKIAQKTILLIEEKLNYNGGLHRYENDIYDGWMKADVHRKLGSGYWPLLNFWFSIVLNKSGDRKKAFKYFNDMVLEVDNKTGFISEQVFDNKKQISVSPLAWSHAMFVLAADELKLIS